MKLDKELIFFGIAGVAGYLVDVAVTSLCKTFLGIYGARIPAFIAAATATWLFNRTLTFAAKKRVHESVFNEYLHYLSLMIFGLVVNYLVYAFSVTILKGQPFNIYISVALGSLAGMTINFFNSKKFLYK